MPNSPRNLGGVLLGSDMESPLQSLLEGGILTSSAVLAVLSESPRAKRKKRKRVKPQPRRGEPNATGAARWQIPIPENAWEEVKRYGADDPSSWAGQRFSSIYGVPKQIFDELVEEARQHKELAGKQYHGDGVRGPYSKPLELKVAGVLEMCQAGLVFKTVERLYKISIPAFERFFHNFTRLQVEHEYKKHVYYPTKQEDINRILMRHALLGFPGIITMFDGVKIGWSGCPQADKFANIGKEGYSTKAYMFAGDACKMVHHVHGSHPGGRNDLTMAHYDEYLQAMRKGLYADQEFDMYSGEGTDTFRESGLSALTDNGFHEWLETQYPSKLSRETWLARWSKRLESVRKPGTECIYGIIKKRFRILAVACSFMDIAQVDNLVRFLVSVHNRLQRFYGLDTLGDDVGDWLMASVDKDLHRIERGTSGAVPHLVNDEKLGNVTVPERTHAWLLRRKAMVTHFKVAWERNEICWLKTAAECRPDYRRKPALYAGRYRDGEEASDPDEPELEPDNDDA